MGKDDEAYILRQKDIRCTVCNDILYVRPYDIICESCKIKQRKDKLDKLFERQIKFQEKVKSEFDQSYRTIQTLACIDELMEALHETPWKPWKKQQSLNLEKYKEELIDAWHFLINLTFPVMTADEFYLKFVMKNEVNITRQDEEY